MNALMALLILVSPMVTQHPVPQDTLHDVNIHFTAGAVTGSNTAEPGVSGGMKLEYLLIHPVVVRIAGNYGHTKVKSQDLPNGSLNYFDLSLETFAYRGKDDYFIYLGIGLVRSFNDFSPDRSDSFFFDNIQADSLLESGDLIGIDMKGGWGYRFILGGRYKEKFSLEFGFQETRPDFNFLVTRPNEKFADITRESKFTVFWVNLGFLIPL